MKYDIKAFRYGTQRVTEDPDFWQLAIQRVRGAQKLWERMELERPKRGAFEERAVQAERRRHAATLKAPPPTKAYARLGDMETEYVPTYWLYRTVDPGVAP